MAKELPYFKFEPAEYLTKDVSFCSLAAQGLFINLCSYYWQRSCKLSKDQFLKRLNFEKELEELIAEGAIDLIDNDIYINFLDVQFEEVIVKSQTNKTNGSKGGRPIKNPIITEPITEIKPKVNPIESESKGIREDKIIEYKITNNNIDTRKLKFAQSLIPFVSVYGNELIRNFCDYWTEPNKSNTKFRQELEKTWDTERRLKTWNQNNFSNNSNNKKQTQDELTKLANEIRNRGN
jgi:hypothetical protein